MARRSLFAMEELVFMILSYLSVPECARILTVNSVFFRQRVKLVWSELSSPAPLFALFGHQKVEIMSECRSLKMTVPKNVPLKRWDDSCKYTDHVRKVTNFRQAFHSQHVRCSGLDHLMRRAPVAANVQFIKVYFLGSRESNTDMRNIIKLLLRPATSTLICHGNRRPGLSVQEARGVLEHAQNVGSRLTDLLLRTENPDDDNAVVALAQQIRSFERLVSVDLSQGLVTGSMLDCIRDLPKLGKLVLCVPHEKASLWDFLTNEGDWIGQSFPSLWFLAFTDSPCSSINRFLSARPSLLHRLTKLHLHMRDRVSRHNDGLESSTSLVELIVSQAPSLEDLTLIPPISHVDGPWIMSPDLLTNIFALNLRRLVFHHVQLQTDSPGLALIDGEWPLLSHLVMPFECVRPAILLQLAKRQALRHLHVEVQAPQPGDEVLTGEMEVNDSTGMMQLESQFGLKETGEHTIETMAR
ncbi:hypothetical protein FRC09_009869 [Ceratobasidium sp. 395]|nr:hypothetical protein FRC09_009869 [Ceratobasidium sp. 395]